LTLVKGAVVDPDLDFLRGDERFEKALADAHLRLGIEPGPISPVAS
jgi:hypothetical protein